MPLSQLTVIGCGVFGRSIVDGLSEAALQTYSLALTHRRKEATKELAADYPNALVTEDNEDPRIWAAGSSLPDDGGRHVVVIATQPQFTASVCDQIRRGVDGSPSEAARQLVVVTLCPGVTLAQLEGWLPPRTPIVRTMPNTPIAVRQGATALFANPHATAAVTAEVQAIFRGMSPVTVVLPREELLEIVASISGSAPAYVFHMMQSLVAAGAAHGLPHVLGHQLVVQACLGSAVLAQQQSGDTTLLDLLADVCVAGGSTEKAIHTLDRLGMSGAVQAAVDTSWYANCAMGKAGGNGPSKGQ